MPSPWCRRSRTRDPDTRSSHGLHDRLHWAHRHRPAAERRRTGLSDGVRSDLAERAPSRRPTWCRAIRRPRNSNRRELPVAAKPRRVTPRYSPADRPPGPWCGWVPGWCGDCLTFDGKEKFYEPVEWLRYLIDHFLRPNARAATSGLGYFEQFTFDHVLDGVIAGSRRDTCELFLIEVRDNHVAKTVLRYGDPQPWEVEPLPYQEEEDRWTSRAATAAPNRNFGWSASKADPPGRSAEGSSGVRRSQGAPVADRRPTPLRSSDEQRVKPRNRRQELGRFPWFALLFLRDFFLRPRLLMGTPMVISRSELRPAKAW